MKKLLKSIIFDFDGTIIDTESLWYDIYFEYFNQHFNYELPLEIFAKGIGTRDEVVFEEIEKDLGLSIDIQEIRKNLTSLFEDRADSLVAREGVVSFIQEAYKSGLQLAIASSSNRDWVSKYLKQFNLESYFTIIKTKDDVQEVKPSPELYLKTLEGLEVNANEVIAIEDSLHGASAAIQAGIKCYVLPNRVTKYSHFPAEAHLIDDIHLINIKELMKTK